MKKKKVSWKVLIWIVLGLLLLAGIIYFVSTRLTGNTVALNSKYCRDSDNGQAIYVPGTCMNLRTDNAYGGIAKIFNDKCTGAKTLTEYYCNRFWIFKDSCVSYTATCAKGCNSTAYPGGAAGRCNQ